MSLPLRRTRRTSASRRGATLGDQTPFLPKEVPTYEALQRYAERFPDLDPESLAAHLSLLHVAGTILNAADPYFARHGLSKARFGMLVILLFEGDSRVSPSDLAQRIGVTRATVTGVLDGLERDGLVRREPSTDDRRRFVVRLSARAEAVLHEFLPGHFRRINKLMGRLTRPERRELVRLLAKVRDGIPALVEDS